MHLNAHRNGYLDEIDRALFDACPKAVFAAIAVSPAMNDGGTCFDSENGPGTPNAYIASEWYMLHRSGIVPQPLPKKFERLYLPSSIRRLHE